MIGNKQNLPGGKTAVKVAVRQVDVDLLRQQSGLMPHFAVQFIAPACFAAWKYGDHYLVFS